MKIRPIVCLFASHDLFFFYFKKFHSSIQPQEDASLSNLVQIGTEKYRLGRRKQADTVS